ANNASDDWRSDDKHRRQVRPDWERVNGTIRSALLVHSPRLASREQGDARQSRQARGYWRPPVPSATPPKSVVQYQPYGEPATYSLPMPMARYVALSMFALRPGLLRQASNTACALT